MSHLTSDPSFRKSAWCVMTVPVCAYAVAATQPNAARSGLQEPVECLLGRLPAHAGQKKRPALAILGQLLRNESARRRSRNQGRVASDHVAVVVGGDADGFNGWQLGELV